jgi:hypothetical protein
MVKLSEVSRDVFLGGFIYSRGGWTSAMELGGYLRKD